MHDLLLRYLAGELDTAESNKIKEKINSDPQWKAEWLRLQIADSAIRSYVTGSKAAPKGYWDNFQIRLDARREARPAKTGLRLTLNYAIPAMAAAALIMIFLNIFRSEPGSNAITSLTTGDLDTALQALKPDWYENYVMDNEASASTDYQMSDEDLKAIRERLNVDFKSVGTDANGYFQTLTHDDQKEILKQLENTTIM